MSYRAKVPGRPRSFDEDQVLERAMNVFWRLGYEGAGIADLEEATRLGRQSLYGAFGSKRELFERVVEFYFERVLKPGVIDVLDAPSCAASNLEQVFKSWEQAASAPDFHGCLVGNAASDLRPRDPELAGVLRRKLQLLEDAFTRALRRAQRDGDVRSDIDPRSSARTLLIISQGLGVVARVQREPAFVRGVVDSARRLLV
jgi:TetR/AcrR family transcriptional repressor of nem operon